MTWLWIGVAEPDQTIIAVKTDAEAAVKLRVSTDVDFGAYDETDAQNTDNDDGRVTQFVLDSLTPDTTYYVRVLVDDVVQESEGRFRTYPVGPASFVFGAASCSDTGADNGVYEDIRDAGLTFFVHLGDLHYLDINEAVHATGVAAHRAGYDASVGVAEQQHLFARVSTPRTWDDHDYSGNNSDGASTGKAAALQTFREAVPVPAAEADGVFYAFTAGRLRVLVLDTRSEREAGDFLGATQEAWLKTECLAAKANGHAIVLCAGVPWIASSGDDTWAGAATQRTRLATFFEDHALDSRILMVSGDMHAVALDDGTNNAWGGFPVLHAAALYRTGSYKGGPYQLGPFHRGTSGDGGPIDSGQWGKVAVTDDGGQSISLTLTGMRNDAVINEQARDSGGSLTGSAQNATLTVSLRAGFDRPVIISPTDDREDPLAVAQVVTFEEAGTGTRMLSTIAVDRTGLGAGTAYVFVQDDAGAWNESGFPVTLRRRVVLSPADSLDGTLPSARAAAGTTGGTTLSGGVTVTPPNGAVGDLILVWATNDNPSTTNMALSDFVEIAAQAYTSNTIKKKAWARLATGTSGATDAGSLTGASQDYSVVVERIKDHGVTTILTDILRATPAIGSSGAPNPPALTLDPATRYRVYASAGSDDDDNATDYEVADWDKVGQAESAQSTSSCMTSVCARNVSRDAAIDPGSMALAATEEWIAFTIAVPQNPTLVPVEQSVTDEEAGDGTRTLTTITADHGSLPLGSAYLFVIDDDGMVNASGFPVTLVSAGGPVIDSVTPSAFAAGQAGVIVAGSDF